MQLKICLMVVFSALFMAGCAHKKAQTATASCCEGQQECSMNKSECSHCQEHDKKEKKDEAKHQH